MARQAERKRLKVLIEVDDELHRGWVLRVVEPRVLIDAGVELRAGRRVTVHVEPSDERVVIDPFEAVAVSACQDVMVPADADHRFLLLLEPAGASACFDALRGALPERPTPRLWTRRAPPTHDLGLLEAALRERTAL